MVINTKQRVLEIPTAEITKITVGFGEGDYIEVPNQRIVREALSDFLPHVTEAGNVLQFQQVVGGKEQATRSKPLGKGDLPITELNRFEAAISRFQQQASEQQAVPKAKQVINKFLLPDPETHPDFYRFYGLPWNRKLLVIWGCEKKGNRSVTPTEALAKLRRQVKSTPQIWLERLAWMLLPVLLLALILFAVTKLTTDELPSALLRITPNPAVMGETVRADASVSALSNKKHKIQKFEIKWASASAFIALNQNSESHVFKDKGDYPVVLRVTDEIGKFALATNIVSILSRGDPRLEINKPISEGSSNGVMESQYFKVTLEPKDGILPGRVVAEAKFPGTVDFHGRKQVPVQANIPFTYDGFNQPGNYRIDWQPAPTARNLHGEFVKIALRNALLGEETNLPIANLQLIPNPARVGIPVRADATGSAHSNPSQKIMKVEIQWESNSPFVPLDKDSESHVFPVKGKFPVILRVTDNLDQTDSVTYMAFVEVPLPQSQACPKARLQVDGVDTNALTVTVSDGGSTTPVGNLKAWRLDWGDSSMVQNFQKQPDKVTHQYEKAGKFNLKLFCINDREEISMPDVKTINVVSGLKPVGETTKPVGETTKPVGETTKPVGETTKPVGETTKPVGETTKPVGETTKPVGETTKPVGEATKPVGETTKPVGEATKPSQVGVLNIDRGIVSSAVRNGKVEVVLLARYSDDPNAKLTINHWLINKLPEASKNSQFTAFWPQGTYNVQVSAHLDDGTTLEGTGVVKVALTNIPVQVVRNITVTNLTPSGTFEIEQERQ